MVLPKYPATISIAQVSNEFKSPRNGASLGGHYAGKGYVPLNTRGFPLGVSTPIPSSGRITLGNFHGALKSTIEENYTTWRSTLSANIQAGSSPLIYVSTVSQHNSLKHSFSIGFRTESFTRAEYDALPQNNPAKRYYTYDQLIPVAPGDIVYMVHGVNSDDYSYVGFRKILTDGTQSNIAYIGGDTNSRHSDATKAWSYHQIGASRSGNTLSFTEFTGKALYLPVQQVTKAGGNNIHKNIEFNFLLARKLTSSAATVEGGFSIPAGHQNFLIPNYGGLPASNPDVFTIDGNRMVLNRDVVVMANPLNITSNSTASAPDNNRAAFAMPDSFPIYKRWNRERRGMEWPLFFKAGSYVLAANSPVMSGAVFFPL